MKAASRRLLTGLSLALLPGAAAGDDRPNILFCFADDWGRCAGAYAATSPRPSPDQVVRTPTLDAIAAQGVLFRNAFVSAPTCTPCRSALLSGRYFFNTGRGANTRGAVWDDAIPAWPLLLRDAGYHLGKTGKVWGPGTPVDAPFGGRRYAYERAGDRFDDFSLVAARRVAEGTPPDAAKEELYAEVRRNFRRFLDERPPDRPFLYWFGPGNIHRPWARGSGAALWGIDPDDLEGKLPAFLPDVPEIREDFADYLGEIQALDGAVGVLLEELLEAGELGRTILVLSGDNGAPGFPGGKCNLYDFGVAVPLIVLWPGRPGGRTVTDFVDLMDVAPTILEIAGVPAPPGLDGRSFVDVLASDRAGLVDPRRTFVVTGRERHVDTAREGNLPYPHRALRTERFLYVRNFHPERWPMGDPYGVTDTEAPAAEKLLSDERVAFPDMDAGPTKAWLVAHRHDDAWRWHYDRAFGKRPGEELYDLARDPDQVHDVAADPAYAAARAEMAARLLRILSAAGDPRVTGDGATFDRPPFTDPAPAHPHLPPGD